MSQEALWHSINALHAWLDTYDLEVWSILCEWDTCTASVKELDEVLVAEESTDEEVEMREEKVRYDVKRGVVTLRQKVVEEDEDGGDGESKSKGLEEEDEDKDEPVHSSGLSVKVKGKCPAL